MVYRKDARIGGAFVQKRVKKMAQVKIKKMAQGKIARRLAFARLNAVRCGGGMTPFSHHTGVAGCGVIVNLAEHVEAEVIRRGDV